ncbi:MAG: hypothetical protein K6G31_06490 [Paludibacteraceae bacterium]|nr:hypothetical protein [Paludibacteraceae bacterium]
MDGVVGHHLGMVGLGGKLQLAPLVHLHTNAYIVALRLQVAQQACYTNAGHVAGHHIAQTVGVRWYYLRVQLQGVNRCCRKVTCETEEASQHKE